MLSPLTHQSLIIETILKYRDRSLHENLHKKFKTLGAGRNQESLTFPLKLSLECDCMEKKNGHENFQQ